MCIRDSFVTVTDANNCTSMQNAFIDEPAPLTLSVFSQSDVSCFGGNNGAATIAAYGGVAPYTFSWNSLSVTTASASGLSAGTYSVSVTDSMGCAKMILCTITQPPALSSTINSVNASCYGSTGSADVTVTGGIPPYTYLWNSTNTSSAITSGLTAGNYSVLVADVNGCSQTSSTTISQPAVLSAAITNIQNASCNNSANGSASVNVAGGTTPYTYQWNNGNTTPAAAALAYGNYSVTVTDANNCSVVQTVFIGQPAILTLNISQSDISCFGKNNATAVASSSGGTAPYTYSWNPTGAVSAAVSGLSAGTYSVSVVDYQGCTKMATFNISEPPALTTTVNAVNASCFGSSNGSASVSASGGTAPYSYLWRPNNAATAAAPGLSAGTYSILVTDANGCSLMKTTTVSQPPVLSASITNIQHVTCNNLSNGSATANVSGGTAPYNYAWNNGVTSASAASLNSGNYSVIVTDSKGCYAFVSANITQPGAMVVTICPNDTICPGQNSNISASSTGGTAPHTYFWQPNIGFGNTQTVSPASSTTYTAIVTDAKGCTSTKAVSIFVHAQNFSLAVNSTPGICKGQNATLSASASGATITNYYWSHNLANNAGPHTISPSVTTTYSVTAFNACGVSKTTTTTVIVHPLPQISIPPQVVSACGRAFLNFSGGSGNNGATYNWNFGDGGTSTQTNPAHSYNQTGVYTVSVTVTSAFGCSSSAHGVCTITVFPQPEASFSSDPGLETSIIHPNFHFFDECKNANSWEWDFGDGKKSLLQNPYHSYEKIGVYTVKLIARNDGGCVDSIAKTIEVKPEFTFYLPNTFTPNGDQINDIFTGKGMEIIEFEMSIFDRWGEEIFKTDDLAKGWGGTAKGGDAIAQEGVYVYQIKLRDFEKRVHNYVGHVNLVR